MMMVVSAEKILYVHQHWLHCQTGLDCQWQWHRLLRTDLAQLAASSAHEIECDDVSGQVFLLYEFKNRLWKKSFKGRMHVKNDGGSATSHTY